MKTMLVLSGVSSAGKSTLLRYSLEKKYPLFGERFKTDFLSFSPPDEGVWQEFTQPIENVVQSKTWISFHENHLSQVSKLDQSKPILAHADLFSVLEVPRREISSLSNAEENIAFFDMYFRYYKILFEYEYVVNHLQIPFSVAQERFYQRCSERGITPAKASRFKIFDYENPQKKAFSAINQAWLGYVSMMKGSTLLITKFEDGKYNTFVRKGTW